MVEHSNELQTRATVWVINPQDIASTARFKEKRGAPFTFLADENLDIVNLYGIYHTQHEEHGHIPYPVTFIIKPDGTVAWRFLGLKPRDRPKVEDVQMCWVVKTEKMNPLDTEGEKTLPDPCANRPAAYVKSVIVA